jgi:ABC-type nitrate/sulfonate/bicarbonate transport system permease component
LGGGHPFYTFRNPATNTGRCQDTSRHPHVCHLRAKHDFHLLYRRILSHPHQYNSWCRNARQTAHPRGARTWNIFLEVVLPGAFPAIVTGLTIGTSSCWLLVVTAEMIAGQFGIGYYTWESYSLQKYPDIVVGMLIIGVLGMLSSAAERFVCERLMPWHRHATRAR